MHSTGFLLLLQPSNQATVLLWNAAVCILTRRLDVFMSQDGRCGGVQGCCRFLCHSAPSDTGPGKTQGSLRRFACSKVTTWQSSGVDLRRVWVLGEVAKSEAFWHEPQWLSRTITRRTPPPSSPPPLYTQTHRRTQSTRRLNCVV